MSTVDLFSLKGKVAVITGAVSGLRIQFAKALAKQGANIAIVARRIEKLKALSSEISALGTDCFPVKCDVTNETDIIDAVKAITQYYGKIDILVNSAGVAVASPAETQSKQDWDKVINANLSGVYLFAREVGTGMIHNKYGKIINIGSIHSNVAVMGNFISAYCSAKGGVLMLTKALAGEWAKYNITVNAIAPAYFQTEMTESFVDKTEFAEFVKLRCPMGRVGKPGELDGALIYLASDASSYTTGQIISVDGGWTAV